MNKIRIELQHRIRDCGDGCCTVWGIDVLVNGQKIKHQIDDESTTNILKDVLKELKVEASVVETYHY